MTDVEQQVAERLQAYGKGLPVTDHDIRAAGEELRSRLDPDAHPRMRPWALAVAASVAVLALVAGAVTLGGGDEESAPNLPATEPEIRAPDGAAPTVELLAGIWKLDDSPYMMRFGADGTFAFDNTGRLEEPSGSGTYRVDGRAIEYTLLGGLLFDAGAQCPAAWLVGLPEEGRLNTVHTRSPITAGCFQDEADVGQEGVMTRVSPPSPASAAIVGDEAGATELAVGRNYGNGLWLQQETGRLLHLEFGTYTVADDGQLGAAPDDGGNYVITQPGVLTLTSVQGSKDCAAGDSTTLEQVRINSSTLIVGTSVSTCQGQADLSGSWVLLAGTPPIE